MNVASGGNFRVHFQKDPTVDFLPLLQKGFNIAIRTGNHQDPVCHSCGLDIEQVRSRVQSVFLNGKPVNDIAVACVHDGDCLSLIRDHAGSGGCHLRSGGILAGFRCSISHRPIERQTDTAGGVLLVRLFDLLIAQMGPGFLQQGILVSATDSQILLKSPTPIQRGDCCAAELNAHRNEIDALASMDWDPSKDCIRLEVTSGNQA
jgi:hypothetical protein